MVNFIVEQISPNNLIDNTITNIDQNTIYWLSNTPLDGLDVETILAFDVQSREVTPVFSSDDGDRARLIYKDSTTTGRDEDEDVYVNDDSIVFEGRFTANIGRDYGFYNGDSAVRIPDFPGISSIYLGVLTFGNFVTWINADGDFVVVNGTDGNVNEIPIPNSLEDYTFRNDSFVDGNGELQIRVYSQTRVTSDEPIENLFLFDGTTNREITTAENIAFPLVLDPFGNNIAYFTSGFEFGEGTINPELYRFDGTNSIQIPLLSLDSNEFASGDPRTTSFLISGDNLAWLTDASTADLSESKSIVTFHNGEETIPIYELDSSSASIEELTIVGSNVAWIVDNNLGSDQLFFYDGSQVIELAEFEDYRFFVQPNPIFQLSDRFVAWVNSDLDGESQVYTYRTHLGSSQKSIINRKCHTAVV